LTGPCEAGVACFLVELTRMCHLDLDAMAMGVAFSEEETAHGVVTLACLSEESSGAG